MKLNAFKNLDKLVFTLMLILAFLLGYNVIYKLAQEKIDFIRLKTEEETKKNEVLKNIAVLNQRLAGYQRRSFSEPDIAQVVKMVSALAQESGVVIEEFNPQSPIDRGHYLELPLKIPFACSYHRLGEFLSLLESNSEFIWIRELKVQRDTSLSQTEAKPPRITLLLGGIYLKK